MAKKDDNRNDNKNGNTIKDTLNRFRSAAKLTTSGVYGVEESFYDDNDRDLVDIKNVISNITKKYKKSSGSDIVEFFNAVSFRDQQNLKSDAGLNQATRDLMDLDSMTNNPEQYNMAELFSQEQNRAQMYCSYRMIYEGIPQMAQGLETYVDNILSPDDFTKEIFNIYMRDLPLTTGNTANLSTDTQEIISKCNNIIDKYKLENNATKILTESLMIGDCFVTVLDLKKELGKMVLSEDYTPQFNESKRVLKEDDIEISNKEVKLLASLLENKDIDIPQGKPISRTQYIKENKDKFKGDNSKLNESYNILVEEHRKNEKIFKEEESKFKQEMADMINNRVSFYEDSSILMESNIRANKEFTKQGKKFINDALFNSFKDSSKRTPKVDKNGKEEDNGIHVNGSIMKVLKPERTVKLELDELCYGYYYIENTENSADSLTTGQYSMISNAFSNMSVNNDQPDIVNNKQKLICDIFVRNIAKKIDKKFVNDNKEFKDIIYNILKQNSLLDKPIRITYLKPNEVVHFGIGNDTYKDSIYKKIHFSAKIYLAVLSSQVMLRLVRSPEKRAFYLETDLDADTEAVVQSFIRDTKTKDIKMSNFSQDINTIMNSVGTFSDYFIPVVDGQKPVEIDTLRFLICEY